MPWRPKVPSPTWRTFLQNHMTDIVAVDMFVVATATFRLFYALIVRLPPATTKPPDEWPIFGSVPQKRSTRSPPIAAVSDDQDDRPLRSSGHGLMNPQPTAQQLNPQLRKNPGEPCHDAKCHAQTCGGPSRLIG
jgi:hypothetical protein